MADRPTGRLADVLIAWGRGVLAEVPVGLGFDAVRTPAGIAPDVVQRMQVAGIPVGPVMIGSTGAEWIVERGSASCWCAPRSLVVRFGTLLLLPPPGVCLPELMGGRGWLVPPTQQDADAPLVRGVTSGTALLEPYLDALQAAEDKAALSTGSAGP